MTKVLLVYANSFMDNLVPVGVSLLSANLKMHGNDVRLFDTTFYRTREQTGDDSRVASLQIMPTNLSDFGIHEKKGGIVQDFQEEVSSFKPDLVGVSVVESTWHIGRSLIESIAGSGIKTVVGGIHATMAPEEVIRQRGVDMLCIGEGEEAIVELADRIGRGKSYKDVRNLWINNADWISRNPVRQLVNLSSLPPQDWSIYEKERFFKPMGGKIWVSGPIELNRGCPYHCAFCCNDQLQKVYRGIGKYPRERSIGGFMQELLEKRDAFGLQYLYLVAENFLQMNDQRFEDFVAGYKDIRLPFWIETRPETVDLERLTRLREVGCEGISIGVEHGNDEFRKRVLNRYVPDETITKAFRIAKQSGARVCANNIIGFPTETRELVFDTIELNRVIDADNIITNIFVPYRGTRLWKVCIDKGYILPESVAGDYRSDAELDMPQLGRDQVKGLQRTFPMYTKFSRESWPEIERAERFDEEGNAAFARLSNVYKEMFMK